jgi:hypothetical protein
VVGEFRKRPEFLSLLSLIPSCTCATLLLFFCMRSLLSSDLEHSPRRLAGQVCKLDICKPTRYSVGTLGVTPTIVGMSVCYLGRQISVGPQMDCVRSHNCQRIMISFPSKANSGSTSSGRFVLSSLIATLSGGSAECLYGRTVHR